MVLVGRRQLFTNIGNYLGTTFQKGVLFRFGSLFTYLLLRLYFIPSPILALNSFNTYYSIQ